MEILWKVNLYEFVEQSPDGIFMHIEEGGKNLSAG